METLKPRQQAFDMFRIIAKLAWAIARQWTMLVAIVVAGALAANHAAERDWFSFAGLMAVVLGISSNCFVMVINGGRMPVQHTEESWLQHARFHQPMHDRTRLPFLGDWISFYRWVLSPGDICLYAGLTVFLIGRWCFN